MKIKHATLLVFLLVVFASMNVSCKPEHSSKGFGSPLDGASDTLKLDGTSPHLSEDDLGIVGGVDVDIKEVPYQVSVIVYGRHFCGGSIISKDIILTAAHCLSAPGLEPSDVKIRVGSPLHAGGELVQVRSFALHPDYYVIQFDSDIAVMLLSKPLQFSESVKPVSMINAEEEVPVGELATASGWGKTEENIYSPTLKMVRIPIISKEVCASSFQGNNVIITPRMLCAGSPNGGKGTCLGDSGGPLVYNGKVVGVVSWGSGKCFAGKSPGVFAKVSALREWIDKTITNLKTKVPVSIDSFISNYS